MAHRIRVRWIPLLLGLGLIVSSTACAPSLAPLYRDFEIDQTIIRERDDVYPRIRSALEEEGWQTVEAAVPNAVATRERSVSNWGIYRVVASLEVVPFGDGYVRVFVHPYRTFITGGRSKIPFLTPTLRRRLISGLNESFENNGLQVRGHTVQLDR
jgi:hypothetical protein